MSEEYFLDDLGVANFDRVANIIVRPTKVGTLFGDPSTDTWDKDKNHFSVIKDGATYKLWYTGVDGSATVRPCYATSSDGLSFDKPTLSLISYGGNTNNNILLATDNLFVAVNYKNGRTPAYLGISNFKAGATNHGVYLYNSSDGTSWANNYKEIYSGALDGNYKEGKFLFERDDGRYLAFYAHGHANQRRQIGAYLSATSDLTGTWADQGVLIDSRSQEKQYYYVCVKKVGSSYIALVGRYQKTPETITTELWHSRDLVTWIQLDAEWVALGAATAWDDAMILGGLDLVEVGNVWRHYYTGHEENHATAGGSRAARIGYATLGRGRLVEINGTGSVTTVPVTVAEGENLKINADCTGGSIDVEVIGVASFTAADCDTIITDSFYDTITWGAAGIPAGQYQLRFDLSTAKLYGYSIS